MRYCRAAALVIVLLACLSATRGPVASAAVRHHFYVGTITALAGGSLAIHSKTHNATYRFVFDKQTRFMRQGRVVARSLFKLGSYVTVSYSPGPRSTLIAWHISLRR
jgi:hypothetical protein